MAAKTGKKNVTHKGLQPDSKRSKNEKLTLVSDQLLEADIMLKKKCKNHEQLTDWIDKAGDLISTFEEWEMDDELNHELKNRVVETLQALYDKMEEYDDKRDKWEERCSFNLAYYYPKHGHELSNDQYCAMFDYDDIDQFDEWCFLAEYENSKYEKVLAKEKKKEIKKENEFDDLATQRERDRVQMKKVNLNLNGNTNIDTHINDLKKVIEKVYDQKTVEEIRAKLTRDIFVDQLPEFMRRRVQYLDSLDKCLHKLKPIFEETALKRETRKDKRQFVDDCSDLSIVFIRNLFIDPKAETKSTTKSVTEALKGKEWWSTDKAASNTSANKSNSKDEIKRKEILDGIASIQNLLGECPQNYQKLIEWGERAEKSKAKLEEWMKDALMKTNSDLKTKLETANDKLKKHVKTMDEKVDDWQTYASKYYTVDLPRKGIKLSDEQYIEFLYNANFAEHDFIIGNSTSVDENTEATNSTGKLAASTSNSSKGDNNSANKSNTSTVASINTAKSNSKDEDKRKQILAGIAFTQALLRERPPDYQTLLDWSDRVEQWLPTLTNWLEDLLMKPIGDLATKLHTITEKLIKQLEMIKEKADEWQALADNLFEVEFPRKGVKVSDDLHLNYLYAYPFSSCKEFHIDYSEIED